MSTQLRSFLRRIRGTKPTLLVPGSEEDTKTSRFKSPAIDKSRGESPLIPFSTLTDIYRCCLVAGPSIDFIWTQAIGPGFHVGIDKNYENEKVEIEIGEDKITVTAKEALDIYNESIGLLAKLRYAARDLWGTGNSFLLIEDIFNPRYLPLEAVLKAYRGENRDWDSQRGKWDIGYKLANRYGGELIPPEDMLHIRWNVINDEAFGTGVLQRLALKMPIGDGEYRVEPYKIEGKLIQAMIEQFELFSAPNELWNFPGLDETTLQSFDSKVRSLPRKGKRLTSNVEKASAKPIVAERARGFDSYIHFLENTYILGTQTPMPKYLTAEGFSEAFAREIRKVMQPAIMAVQEHLSGVVAEKLWNPVLEHYGFDPLKAKAQLVWKTMKVLDPEMMLRMLPFLIRMVENGSVKPPEFRRVLRDMVGLPLDKDDKVEITLGSKGGGTSPRSSEPELATKQTGPQREP